jgi:hypothetical protein
MIETRFLVSSTRSSNFLRCCLPSGRELPLIKLGQRVLRNDQKSAAQAGRSRETKGSLYNALSFLASVLQREGILAGILRQNTSQIYNYSTPYTVVQKGRPYKVIPEKSLTCTNLSRLQRGP